MDITCTPQKESQWKVLYGSKSAKITKSGLEVLRRLKAAPETSSIPIILLTALDEDEDILTGSKMGSDHYITKPFKSAHLMTVIDHLLSGDIRYSVKGL